MIKLMLILDQVRLSKGQLCPAGLGKGLIQGPAGTRNRKKIPLQLILNNHRSNILPASTFDPKHETSLKAKIPYKSI